MRNISLGLILAGAVLAAALAGCTSANTAPNPPTIGQRHLYVGNVNTGALYAYNLPLSVASTPSVTVAGAGVSSGLAVFGNKIYAIDDATVEVYSLPLTASSSPIQTLTLGHPGVSIVADASGTIYVAENNSSTCCVDVFQGGASTPTFTLSGASVDAPYGVAIDSGGNAFLANAGSIGYFAATVHSGEAGIAFGRDNFNEGLVTDSSDNLYVADGDGPGTMDVYHSPYTTSTAVASTVTLSGFLEQMAMSSGGTMYIAVETPNQIDVLSSPYTSVSVTLSFSYEPYGVAVGP